MTNKQLQECINKFKKNDYSCFNDFYKETSKQVYFTALGIIKDSSFAEDIMQDTYISFLNTIDRFKTGNNVFGYLTVIARNKALNYLKRDKNIVFNDEILKTISEEEFYEEESISVEEILQLLDKQIEREIITYHVLLDYKFKDISKIVNKPLGTVLWIYNKAMKTLKERIGEIYEK